MAASFGFEPLLQFVLVLIAAFLVSVQDTDRALEDTDQAWQDAAVFIPQKEAAPAQGRPIGRGCGWKLLQSILDQLDLAGLGNDPVRIFLSRMQGKFYADLIFRGHCSPEEQSRQKEKKQGARRVPASREYGQQE
jgi:hypothetical protein